MADDKIPPTLPEIRRVVERIYDHEAEARISPWHVREALRMLLELMEAQDHARR